MSLIERNAAREMAADLFEQAIEPLAAARAEAGDQAYFPLTADADRESYFEMPPQGVMTAADFEFPGGGTAEGLIEALSAAWTAEGELDLAVMAPVLREIAEALREEAAAGDGSVSILCYTMF